MTYFKLNEGQATRPKTQITHTRGGRQSLAPVETIGKQQEQETVSHPECE